MRTTLLRNPALSPDLTAHIFGLEFEKKKSQLHEVSLWDGKQLSSSLFYQLLVNPAPNGGPAVRMGRGKRQQPLIRQL